MNVSYALHCKYLGYPPTMKLGVIVSSQIFNLEGGALQIVENDTLV